MGAAFLQSLIDWWGTQQIPPPIHKSKGRITRPKHCFYLSSMMHNCAILVASIAPSSEATVIIGHHRIETSSV